MHAPSEEQRLQLIADIHTVFADVVLGNGFSLHQADAIDDFLDDNLVAAARVKDNETRWQDISAEKVNRFYNALYYVGPQGFRFYFPRYMIQTLENVKTSSTAADDTTIAVCNHPEFFELFSLQQRRAVACFLQFFERIVAAEMSNACPNDIPAYVDPAANALQLFWNQYL